jgi:hypothetical protein
VWATRPGGRGQRMAANLDISELSSDTIARDVEHTLVALWNTTRALVSEIRIPGAKPVPLRGYFDAQHFGAAARAVVSIDAPGIYVTLNPVKPELLRLSPCCLGSGRATTDADIERRRLLLLDFDPERAAKVSSTDAEKAASYERALACRAWLLSRGWPQPILGDSGNGFHLLSSIDLPADEVHHDLVTRVLQTLAQRFSDDAVKLDTTVGNASRITKLYGTWSRKGPTTTERPHRRSALIEVPRAPGNVSLRQLQELAALFEEKPRQPRAAPHTNGNGSASTGHAEYAEIEAALTYINADPRDAWLHIGAALQDELGENGRGLWDAWSSRSAKYDEQDQDRTWRGFETGGGITIKTLFKLAYDAGWPGPAVKSSDKRDDEPPEAQTPPPDAATEEPPGEPPKRRGKAGKWPAARVAAEIKKFGARFAQDAGSRLYVFQAGVYNPDGAELVRERVKTIVPDDYWSSHLARETTSTSASALRACGIARRPAS